MSPLFLKVYASYREVMQHNLAFYQLCLEHLGFLVNDHGFEVVCETSSGPESYTGITFSKLAVKIEVSVLSFELPVLYIFPFPVGRLVEWCSLENQPTNYEEAFKRVHPLDALGQDRVSRAHRDATAARIERFGKCVREDLERM